MYELVNVFESFLPQLLTYPNPADPLNLEAANLMAFKAAWLYDNGKECGIHIGGSGI